jgi:hypothetical protein
MTSSGVADTHDAPYPRLLRAFLTQHELCALRVPTRWYTSTIVSEDGDLREDPHRVSQQCRLSRTTVRMLQSALRRCKGLVGVSACDLKFEEGSWVRYDVGQFFGVHGDASGLDDGRRRFTLLVGIEAATIGGETHFPYLRNAMYVLERGDALLWCNYDADGREQGGMDHEACVVRGGRKVVINAWFS